MNRSQIGHESINWTGPWASPSWDFYGRFRYRCGKFTLDCAVPEKIKNKKTNNSKVNIWRATETVTRDSLSVFTVSHRIPLLFQSSTNYDLHRLAFLVDGLLTANECKSARSAGKRTWPSHKWVSFSSDWLNTRGKLLNHLLNYKALF